MLMQTDTARYAKAIENSKRMRFDIDRDVIRGRQFDFTKKFLPDGLSKVDRLVFLNAAEQRLLSQIQGRSYANIFGGARTGIAAVQGFVMAANRPMLALASKLGFAFEDDADPEIVRIGRPLGRASRVAG